jgi:hypothetical protein
MSGLIIVIVAFLAILGVAWVVAVKLGMIKPGEQSGQKAGGDAKAPTPYVARDRLLSPAEASFHSVLRQALPILTEAAGKREPPLVFAKVRLVDILDVAKGLSPAERQGALNRINSKHVDFVLCDPEKTRPLLMVELDDASHGRADRKSRDEFVDRAAAAAGVPLLHVKAAAGYSPRALAGELGRVLGVGKADAMASSAGPA